MLVPSGKWSVSLNGERFGEAEYNSKDEAIEAVLKGLESKEGYYFEDEIDFEPLHKSDVSYFYVGQAYCFEAKIDVDDVIERLQESCYNELDEWGESYLEDLPNSKKEDLESRLNQAFKEWEHKWHMAHNSFIVDDVERVLV